MIGVWRIDCRFALANLGGGQVSVHHRHLDIHQHGVEIFRSPCIDRLLSIVGHFDRVPRFAQRANRELLIRRIVLGQQQSESL